MNGADSNRLRPDAAHKTLLGINNATVDAIKNLSWYLKYYSNNFSNYRSIKLTTLLSGIEYTKLLFEIVVALPCSAFFVELVV